MGNLISGILLLCAIIGMFFWYRPKRKDSLKICGIGHFMALLSIMMDDGIVSLQVVQHLMQFFVLSSCFLQLRQEKKQRKIRKVVHRERVRQVHLQEEKKTSRFCA